MDHTEALAIEIVKKLNQAGFIAYFAGGWVRDHLLGRSCADIDIATDAPPEKILDLFPRTVLVGLAFNVVVIMVDSHQFEISTFRKDLDYHDGRRPASILKASAEEDAKRRDFTINGMFFDPINRVVHDFVNGASDLTHGIIRAIGDPDERFREDRLRMIRAIRFAARFGFAIEIETQDAIRENAHTLFPAVAMERIWQEFNKMASYPYFDHALIEMHRLELLPIVFPSLKGTHLNDIKARVAHFSHFPTPCPNILFLLQLFPNINLEERLEICQYLRTSQREIKLVEFYTYTEDLIQKEEQGLAPLDIVEWVYQYSHPDSQLCLDVLATHFDKTQIQNFLQKHVNRKQIYLPYIERIQQKKPVVTAQDLKHLGIPPGKNMGVLLKNAEHLAINQNCQDSLSIIEQLKKSPNWPT